MGVQERVPRNRNSLFDRNNRNMFLKIQNFEWPARARLRAPALRAETKTALPRPGCAVRSATLLCGDPAMLQTGCATTRLCGNPAVRQPGYAATRWLCGNPGPAVRQPCAATRLCDDPAVRRSGCAARAATRRCGNAAVQRPGCAATRLCYDSAAVRRPRQLRQPNPSAPSHTR